MRDGSSTAMYCGLSSLSMLVIVIIVIYSISTGIETVTAVAMIAWVTE
jgi:hypothetical protein